MVKSNYSTSESSSFKATVVLQLYVSFLSNSHFYTTQPITFLTVRIYPNYAIITKKQKQLWKDKNISVDCLGREIPYLILWMISGPKLMGVQLISEETRFHFNSSNFSVVPASCTASFSRLKATNTSSLLKCLYTFQPSSSSNTDNTKVIQITVTPRSTP